MALHTGGYLTQRLPGRSVVGLRCPRTPRINVSSPRNCRPAWMRSNSGGASPEERVNDQFARGQLNHSMSVWKPGTSFSHLWCRLKRA